MAIVDKKKLREVAVPKPETSWIVPFLGDLRDFAKDHGLNDLASDIEQLIDTHGPVLGNRTRTIAADRLIETDMAVLQAQLGRKPH